LEGYLPPLQLNFAMESIEQTFNGQADFGRRVTCTISRNGDLAYRTYLQVTLPQINQQMLPAGVGQNLASNVMGSTTPGADNKGLEYGVFARWLDFPGEQMVSMVEVEIGGQRIDRQYGDWMHIWNQLTLTAEQQRGLLQKWLVTPHNLPSSLIHHSPQSMVPVPPLHQLRFALPVMPFLRPLSTFHSSSGTAAIQVLALPFNCSSVPRDQD